METALFPLSIAATRQKMTCRAVLEMKQQPNEKMKGTALMKKVTTLILSLLVLAITASAQASDCRQAAAESIVLSASLISKGSQTVRSTSIPDTKGNGFKVRVGDGRRAEAIYDVNVSLIETDLEDSNKNFVCIIESLERK